MVYLSSPIEGPLSICGSVVLACVDSFQPFHAASVALAMISCMNSLFMSQVYALLEGQAVLNGYDCETDKRNTRCDAEPMNHRLEKGALWVSLSEVSKRGLLVLTNRRSFQMLAGERRWLASSRTWYVNAMTENVMVLLISHLRKTLHQLMEARLTFPLAISLLMTSSSIMSSSSVTFDFSCIATDNLQETIRIGWPSSKVFQALSQYLCSKWLFAVSMIKLSPTAFSIGCQPRGSDLETSRCSHLLSFKYFTLGSGWRGAAVRCLERRIAGGTHGTSVHPRLEDHLRMATAFGPSG
ncbi:hypothetical protein KC325_g123 [Hortaea werneckii]|nr:hypothetical protein KC325_g123 [Hortaea werneckii]